MVRESDARVALDLTDRFVAEHVPDDDRRSAAKLLRSAKNHSLSVTHHCARRAQLVLAHLQRMTRVKVPYLAIILIIINVSPVSMFNDIIVGVPCYLVSCILFI